MADPLATSTSLDVTVDVSLWIESKQANLVRYV